MNQRTAALLLKISAVLWVIWGLVHMLAGVLTTNFVLTGDIASAIGGIADGVDAATLQMTYPDALGGILGQHGFNLLWFGVVTLIGRHLYLARQPDGHLGDGLNRRTRRSRVLLVYGPGRLCQLCPGNRDDARLVISYYFEFARIFPVQGAGRDGVRRSMPRSKQFDEQEVLKKAMMLFWKQGYHATSMQDLVDHLGINRASLYTTFGGKRNLFDRAFDQYRQHQSQGLARFLESQEDVVAALRLLFHRLIQDDVEDESAKGCFIVNTTTELLPGDPALQETLLQHEAHIQGLFRDALERGVARGQVAEGKDLAALARLLYTLMTGLRVMGKTKPDPVASMASVEVALQVLR